MRWLFLFCFCVLLASCAGPQRLSGTKSLKKQYLHSEVFNSHFSGLVFKDLTSQRLLLGVNGQHFFTPASNVKLLTFYAADKMIIDSIPAFRYCLVEDTLYFSGMGDPTFLHPDFEIQRAALFLKSESYIPVYCPPVFIDKKFGPGWAWDDYPYYFQPEKSAFPIMGNSIWLKTDSLGRLAIFPDFFPISFRGDADTSRVLLDREEDRNVFSIANLDDKDELDSAIPFGVNDTLIVRMLQSVVGDYLKIGTFPVECESDIYFSHPKDSVFRKMLVDSDNFIAEQLLIGASALLSDSLSVDLTIAYAMNSFFREWKNEIKWRDGSGLSRYNQLSPDFLVWLLERMYRESDWERLNVILPEGGSQGTLRNFLKSDVPFIYAKSGSMTGVYNLSGYLKTNKGNLIAFSIMNNNIKVPFQQLKGEVEKLLVYVRENY